MAGPRSHSRRPKNNRVDALVAADVAQGSEYVAEVVASLQGSYADWNGLEGRANERLWALLGHIHQASYQVDDSPGAKTALIAEVKKLDDVRMSNRWRAERKHSSELLLTTLLGLRAETKSTKSQWMKSLKIAREQKIPNDHSAFIGWVKDNGGISGVNRIGKKKREKKVPAIPLPPDQAVLAKIEEFSGAQTDLGELERTIRVKKARSKLPHGIGILVVKEVQWSSTEETIEVIGRGLVSEPNLIAQAIDIVLEDKNTYLRKMYEKYGKDAKKFLEQVRKDKEEGFHIDESAPEDTSVSESSPAVEASATGEIEPLYIDEEGQLQLNPDYPWD